MNLLLAILLGTGAAVGALGMLLLIAGGVAAAMMEADSAAASERASTPVAA